MPITYSEPTLDNIAIVIEEIRPYIRAVIRRALILNTRCGIEVEDCMQDAMVTIVEHWNEYIAAGVQRNAWISRIIFRDVVHSVEGQSSRAELRNGHTDVGWINVRDRSPTAEDSGYRVQMDAWMARLRALNPQYADAVELRLRRGLSYEESAMILSTTREMVRCRVHRARAVLKAYARADGYDAEEPS